MANRVHVMYKSLRQQLKGDQFVSRLDQQSVRARPVHLVRLMQDLLVSWFQFYVQAGLFFNPSCCHVVLNLASHGFIQIHAEIVVAEVILRSFVPAQDWRTLPGSSREFQTKS